MTCSSGCVKLLREARHQYSDVAGCLSRLLRHWHCLLTGRGCCWNGMQLVMQLPHANAADDVVSSHDSPHVSLAKNLVLRREQPNVVRDYVTHL